MPTPGKIGETVEAALESIQGNALLISTALEIKPPAFPHIRKQDQQSWRDHTPTDAALLRGMAAWLEDVKDEVIALVPPEPDPE